MSLLGFPVFCLSSSMVLSRYLDILVNSGWLFDQCRNSLKLPKIAWPIAWPLWRQFLVLTEKDRVWRHYIPRSTCIGKCVAVLRSSSLRAMRSRMTHDSEKRTVRFGLFGSPYKWYAAVSDKISEVIFFITHLVPLSIRIVSQSVVVELGVV